MLAGGVAVVHTQRYRRGVEVGASRAACWPRRWRPGLGGVDVEHRSDELEPGMMLRHLLSSSREAPPLRVALLLDGGSVARPLALVVEHIQRCDFATIELVIHLRPPPARVRRRGLLGLAGRLRLSTALFDLYARLDRERVTTAGDPLAPLDVAARLTGVESLVVERGAGETLRLPDEVAARVREHHLDVAIHLGSARLDAVCPRIAREGTWSYAPGDRDSSRGGPAHFWELADRDPLSRVSLRALGERPDQATVLCEGVASTILDHSLARNRVKPQLLGSTFVIRKLKELHERGSASLSSGELSRRGAPADARDGRTPTNVAVATFLAPHLLAKARERLVAPQVVHWRMAIRAHGAPRFEAGERFDTSGFRLVEAPHGHLYADPFLLERDGQCWCFFEDYDHARRKGLIACARVSPAGELQDVRSVLERPYHLSYPCVFDEGREVFMVPESRRNGTVDLFRAVEFPDRWEKVRTLLDGPGLDATVLHHRDRYWFFVAVREPEGAGEQLLLYHAESLTDELRFHPENPISADVRYCRPGGALFRDGGRLIRPSQDCSVTYGHQLHFHHVVTLTPETYRETLLATVPPWAGMEGTHTYNRCGGIEVMDVKRMERASRHVPEARPSGA